MAMVEPSVFSRDRTPYPLQYPWPAEYQVQCGDQGFVLTAEGSYRTAFFEVFPPGTFIRGEGPTIAEAEADAYTQYQRQLQCAVHSYDRGAYRNGYGICTQCGHGALVFEPLERCVICQAPTYFLHALDGQWYCACHQDQVPPALVPPSSQLLQRLIEAGCLRPPPDDGPEPLQPKPAVRG